MRIGKKRSTNHLKGKKTKHDDTSPRVVLSMMSSSLSSVVARAPLSSFILSTRRCLFLRSLFVCCCLRVVSPFLFATRQCSLLGKLVFCISPIVINVRRYNVILAKGEPVDVVLSSSFSKSLSFERSWSRFRLEVAFRRRRLWVLRWFCRDHVCSLYSSKEKVGEFWVPNSPY